MATFYRELDDKIIKFIEQQNMFFVATAPKEGRINLSPKGLNCLKILSPRRIAYVNLTGSGNETSAHLLDDNRMVMMFCSFSRTTNIIRLYGSAREVAPQDDEFEKLYENFENFTGVRQIYILDIDNIQKSCGYGVPIMDFVEQRDTLNKYMDGLGQDGIHDYQQDRNLTTIDGLRTRLQKIKTD